MGIRYNIVAIPGLQGGDGPRMTVRFKDTGANSRVIVWLREYNIWTGNLVTRMMLDSNDYGSSSTYQTRTVSKCTWPWTYDFNNKVYYIETSIVKTNSAAGPGLASVQLGWTIC